ncbi:hypothetical protein NQK81_01300 [Amycolatopsis roodepoortensis]|uniref:hypothetical protein n=1 Tax=Amycolatopsis roodepoortensis TaxID=700274 RepID=UPI00214AB627|nr:hypothetical protein [Amycolatopsis roodepoortensis]UUV32111.1 hypothetical protein NQK81_01300 [Amycolatopsis roodepoortensis]
MKDQHLEKLGKFLIKLAISICLTLLPLAVAALFDDRIGWGTVTGCAVAASAAFSRVHVLITRDPPN